eukprot:696716-Rhodomonas_salina.1
MGTGAWNSLSGRNRMPPRPGCGTRCNWNFKLFNLDVRPGPATSESAAASGRSTRKRVCDRFARFTREFNLQSTWHLGSFTFAFIKCRSRTVPSRCNQSCHARTPAWARIAPRLRLRLRLRLTAPHPWACAVAYSPAPWPGPAAAAE